MPKKILVTGKPEIGKTTVIRKVADGLQKKGIKVLGFYTQEIRENNKRVGFKIIGLDGSCGILAHVNFKSNYRVGRYFVKLDALEECIRNINKIADAQVLIIDEIGKMELFSWKFKEFINKIFSEDRIIIATVGEKFVKKFRENAEVIRVTSDNRDSVPEIITHRL